MQLGLTIFTLTPEMLAADPELAAQVASAPPASTFGVYPFLSPARTAQANELEKRGCLIGPKPIGWSVAPVPRDPTCPVSSFDEWLTPAERKRYHYWLEYLQAQRSSMPPAFVRGLIALFTWGIGTAFETAAEVGTAVAEASASSAVSELAFEEFAIEAGAEAASELVFEEIAAQSFFEEAAGEFAAESFFEQGLDFGFEAAEVANPSVFEESFFDPSDFGMEIPDDTFLEEFEESFFDPSDFGMEIPDDTFLEEFETETIAEQTGQNNWLTDQIEKQAQKEVRKRVMSELFKPSKPAPRTRTVTRAPQVIYRSRSPARERRTLTQPLSEPSAPRSLPRSMPQTVSPASFGNSAMNMLYQPDTVSMQPPQKEQGAAFAMSWTKLAPLALIPIAAIILFRG